MSVPNSDAALRGKIGGYAKAAKHDSVEATQPAREAFLRRFWPCDPGLTEEERERRAQAALRAYMAKLAYRSAKARGKRSPNKQGAADA